MAPILLEFGPYTIDCSQRLLRKGTNIVPLAPKIFDLLIVFAENAGQTLDRESLLKKLWPDTFVEDGSLSRNVSTLRNVLGDSPQDQRYILTVPKRGYCFVAQVSMERCAIHRNGTAKGALPVSDQTLGAEIRVDLTPEQQPFGDKPLVQPEAYDCYLRGRFYAQSQNRDDNETAIASLEHAVAISPAFASAYAELAQAYTWKLFLFEPQERQWEEKAFVAIEKALSLDPRLAVAYLARGRLLWTPANHFAHARAIREYRQALALNPNLDEARNQLALICSHIGYFDEALRLSQEAVLANPNNHLAVYRSAQTLIYQGKFDEGLALLRSIPEKINPSLIGYQTAWALFNLGRFSDASVLITQMLRDYSADDGALFLSMQAVLAAATQKEQSAETKINMAIKHGKGFGHFHHAAYHIAVAFALMNRVAPALEWLNFASRDGFPCYPLFLTDPNLVNIRKDARFATFMGALRCEWLGYQALLA